MSSGREIENVGQILIKRGKGTRHEQKLLDREGEARGLPFGVEGA